MQQKTTTPSRIIVGVATLIFVGPLATDTRVRATEVPTPSAGRPNILLIMTDQQHAGMMSCTGNKHLETPALDRLAAAGVRFERTYASNPVCVPSRFSLQTGRMPSEVGMRQNNTRVEVPQSMLTHSLGPLLSRAGYDCAYGGKVHLPGDLGRHMMKHGYHSLTGDARQKLADASAAFIRQQRDKPFFLFASFINPHDICYMAINDFARKRGGKAARNLDSQICEQILDEARNAPDLKVFIEQNCPPVPSNLDPPQGEPTCITTHYAKVRGFRQFARTQWTDDMWRLHRWLYCRLTERVDTQIGVILDALRETELDRNTLVIFTSDHGDMDGAHRLEHKSVLYEEAVRVPLLVSWPSVIPAERVDDTHLISNGLDLLPTLCDFAGIDAPPGLPGRSFRPVAEGNTPNDWRTSVVAESQNGRMVRTDQFKYVVYDCGEHREFLVNLKNDPGEMINLASRPEHRDTLDAHRRLMRDWVRRWNDKIAQKYIVAP